MAEWDTCTDCHKRAYHSRRGARAAAKQIPGRHMTAYRCPRGPGWHLGHMPDKVRHGTAPKASFEREVRRRQGIEP